MQSKSVLTYVSDFHHLMLERVPNVHYRREERNTFLRASSMTISPAATSVSLFAIAIVIPERIASSVGLVQHFQLPHSPIHQRLYVLRLQ